MFQGGSGKTVPKPAKNENKDKNKTLLPNHMSGPFVEEMKTLLQRH